MAQYDELAKLGRVKLPSGTTYALIDVDGRAMLAPNFSTAVAYSAGDYVIYQDDLYRFDTAHAPGPWDPTQVTQVQVGQELKRIIGLISGGVPIVVKLLHQFTKAQLITQLQLMVVP